MSVNGPVALYGWVSHAVRLALVIGANAFGFAAEVAADAAVVRRAPEIEGRVIGSVRVLTAEPVALEGNAQLTADLIMPGTPNVRVEGRATYLGIVDGSGAAEPSGYVVKLAGRAQLRNVVRRSEPVSLPAVPPAPKPSGTRQVTLNAASEAPGDFATIRDLKAAGKAGRVTVPGGSYGVFSARGHAAFVLGVAGSSAPVSYAFEKLECEGGSALEVVGPVIVTIGRSASFHDAVGNAAHPEWLEIRLAAGEIKFGSKADAAAFVSAPSGRLVLEGQSRLKGGARVHRLAVGGASTLELVGETAANQPPSIALVSPANGASFIAPATIDLTATAADADGTVAWVEFFQNGVKFAETSVAPYSAVRPGVADGTHTFFAKATDNRGLSANSSVVTVTVTAEVPVRSLPFAANFEVTEGYSVGPLDGIKGWVASAGVAVIDADASAGGQSVLLSAGEPARTASRIFNDVGGVVYVDAWTLPPVAATPTDAAAFSVPEAARAALVGDLQGARFHVQDGAGWRAVGPQISVDAEGFPTEWTRLTMRIDYDFRRWDFYLNGRMVAEGLGFSSAISGSFQSLKIFGQRANPTLLDDLFVGLQHPLFADADGDGMDDAWESAHGLNPAVNDRDGDLDGDGLTNVRESALGSSPMLVDSDGDGMPDGWEAAHGLSPARRSENEDADSDGVSDLFEYLQGRNPTKGAVADLTGAVHLRVHQPR